MLKCDVRWEQLPFIIWNKCRQTVGSRVGEQAARKRSNREQSHHKHSVASYSLKTNCYKVSRSEVRKVQF